MSQSLHQTNRRCVGLIRDYRIREMNRYYRSFFRVVKTKKRPVKKERLPAFSQCEYHVSNNAQYGRPKRLFLENLDRSGDGFYDSDDGGNDRLGRLDFKA